MPSLLNRHLKCKQKWGTLKLRLELKSYNYIKFKSEAVIYVRSRIQK